MCFAISGRFGGRAVGEGGLVAAPVELSLDDEFTGGGLEPVDYGLGEQRVDECGQPLVTRSHFLFDVTSVADSKCRFSTSSQMSLVSVRPRA